MPNAFHQSFVIGKEAIPSAFRKAGLHPLSYTALSTACYNRSATSQRCLTLSTTRQLARLRPYQSLQQLLLVRVMRLLRLMLHH